MMIVGGVVVGNKKLPRLLKIAYAADTNQTPINSKGLFLF